MFGSIGIPELIIILVVALVVIGPKRLPEVAKSIGRSLRDLKRATSDLQDSISLDDVDYDPYPASGTEEKKDDTASTSDETAAPDSAASGTSAPDVSPDASSTDVSEKGNPAS